MGQSTQWYGRSIHCVASLGARLLALRTYSEASLARGHVCGLVGLGQLPPGWLWMAVVPGCLESKASQPRPPHGGTGSITFLARDREWRF